MHLPVYVQVVCAKCKNHYKATGTDHGLEVDLPPWGRRVTWRSSFDSINGILRVSIVEGGEHIPAGFCRACGRRLP